MESLEQHFQETGKPIISTTLNGITTVLQQGTALVQASSVLVGQLSTLAAVA